PLLGEGTLTTDLFVDLHERPAQLLILPELRDLGLRLTLRGRGGEAFRYRLAPCLVGEAKRGAMARLTRPMAVAAGISATPAGGGNRTGTKVPQLGKLARATHVLPPAPIAIQA